MQVAKYDPRIGDLFVEFIDYYNNEMSELQDISDGLEDFGGDLGLALGDTYQIALMLREHGYAIDPVAFHPDQVAGEPPEPGELQGLEQQYQTRSVYDDYEDALRTERYEDAHQIFEGMTLDQQQMIRDRSRRGEMVDRLKKTAQEADTEAVLEKEIPVEPAEGVQVSEDVSGQGNLALIDRAQALIDN